MKVQEIGLPRVVQAFILRVHESEKLWTNCGHVSNMCQICVEMRTGNLGGIGSLNTFWLLVLVQTCLEKRFLSHSKYF